MGRGLRYVKRNPIKQRKCDKRNHFKQNKTNQNMINQNPEYNKTTIEECHASDSRQSQRLAAIWLTNWPCRQLKFPGRQAERGHPYLSILRKKTSSHSNRQYSQQSPEYVLLQAISNFPTFKLSLIYIELKDVHLRETVVRGYGQELFSCWPDGAQASATEIYSRRTAIGNRLEDGGAVSKREYLRDQRQKQTTTCRGACDHQYELVLLFHNQLFFRIYC
jgi:hypothetical protein